MGNSLTIELVTEDGVINQEASKGAFEAALLVRVSEVEVQQTQIAKVVSEIFDLHFGKAIAMPILGSMVAQKMNAQPENFRTLSDRALNYVRENSQERKAADGTVTKHEDSLFLIGKGKGGGCSRRADAQVKSDKK